MAITVVQHKHNDTAATGQTSLAVTITSSGSGNLIVVCFGGVGTVNPVTGVTDNAGGGSSSYSLVASSLATDTGSGIFSVIYASTSSHSGATTVTVAFSSTDFPSCEVWEVSGFTTPTSDGVNVVNNGASSASPLGASITTTATAGFMVGFITPTNLVTVNPKAGNEFTSGGDIGTNNGSGAVSLIYSTAAAHQPQWDVNIAGTFAASSAAWKEAAGNSSSVSPSVSLSVSSSVSPSVSPSSSVSRSVSPSVSPSSSVSSSASPSTAPPAFVERTVFVYID